MEDSGLYYTTTTTSTVNVTNGEKIGLGSTRVCVGGGGEREKVGHKKRCGGEKTRLANIKLSGSLEIRGGGRKECRRQRELSGCCISIHRAREGWCRKEAGGMVLGRYKIDSYTT